MKIKKILKENNNKEKILQYYTNAQVLELLKQEITELEYYQFLNKSTKDVNTITDSSEAYLEDNISISRLLELVEQYNLMVYNKLLSRMVNNIY